MSKVILPARAKNLAGLKVGRLAVIELASLRPRRDNKGVLTLWKCRCKCGTDVIVLGRSLVSALKKPGVGTRSCGCLQKEKAARLKFKHGKSRTKLYKALEGIRFRCENPKCKAFKNYGGRGIRLCRRWKGKNGLRNFAVDVGNPPSPRHTIERKNNELGYFPGNVIWATHKANARNTRANKKITWSGRTMCVTEWAEELGILACTLFWRLKHWSIEIAMTRPIAHWGKKSKALPIS